MFLKKIKSHLLLAALLTLAQALHAQTFGGHPPGLQWQEINTHRVRVIFPKGMEKQAIRAADIIHYMQENNRRSVGDMIEKVDLVIQNQTVVPNGYVSVAPFRSEFFATPPQDPNLLGSLDWMDVLAIHEYRHVQQFSNADRGFTTLLRALFGEQGWGAGAFLSIPNWYWEGDAVVAETALTPAGRGRLPAFTLEQRALLLGGRNYSYMKARNGSWKDLLPNHYPLGYALCNYGREKFGNDIWKDVFFDAARYRTVVYPFSGALKKHTGLRTRTLYRNTYKDLEKKWKAEQKSLAPTPFTKINRTNKSQVTNYNYPHPMPDGSTLCVRERFDKIAELVTIAPDGTEKRLTPQGIVIDNYISVTNGNIAWSEIETHPRWGNVFYSIIATYDYKTGKKARLTAKSKYFSPAFSHSGDRLVAVHISAEQVNELHVLHAATGEVLQKIPNPDNHFLMYPQWTPDDRAIVFIDKKGSEMALARHDLDRGTTLPLMDYTVHVINTPHVAGDEVYFSASFSGIDNIYVVKMGDRAIRQVTSARVGAFQPAVSKDGKTLLYSDFTLMGHDVVKTPLDPAAWPVVSLAEPAELYTSTAISTEGGNILPDIPAGEYEAGDYRPPFMGLKLHSYSFFGQDPNSLRVTGLMNNVLNTAALTVGIGYNLNESSPETVVEYTHGTLFPVLHVEGAYSRRKADYLVFSDLPATLNFNEARIGAGVSLPLQWFRGPYSGGLELSAKTYYRDVRDFKLDSLPVFRPDIGFADAEVGIALRHLRKMAPQHIRPRLGIVARAFQERGLTRNDIGRSRLLGRFYLPGILPSHGIEIETDYQAEKLTNAYQYGDFFEYARGFVQPVNDRVWRVGANYHFPIVYPDWGFGGLMYFRRIRGNVFYDQSRFWYKELGTNLRSTGGELILDIQLFNLPVVASMGFRYSFLLTDDPLDINRTRRFEIFAATEL